ncbi:MAG: peroxiredoxin [Hydrocarboniphaga sp.]|uniref:peroxiredoxin n=1 Tax=Hydrocarboniphaga sp. TaxID=2033016 RepID=UPI0026126E07|nr:peroxiredoxin [Hydrocarboniphaga sp.]MDB5968112.1 peroxiredoxin [Hydrocarboniphaga sp.]
MSLPRLRLAPRLMIVAMAAIISIPVAMPVLASLKPGTVAPLFTADASLAGQPFTFSLTEALKKGPVVLYFYPAAFSSGCNVEAHKFAEATEQFKALGAQVIGVSKDDLDTLHKFSVSECGGKFAVAADPKLTVAKSYDATLMLWPGHSDRTSYVIAPDGKILYAYSALSPDDHVKNTLQALKSWHDAQAVR